MTGASGGGYNTWITAVLDDRIRVLVPVVGTSDFYLQLRHTRDNDWYHAGEHCHFIPGLLRFANNHEFVAMVAPRPTLVINATDDPGFPIGDVHRYGQRLYADYAAEEKFRYFEDSSSGHGYQVKKREAAYGWFLRWLMGRGDGGPFPEPPTETRPFDAPELRCFEDGRKRPAGPGIIAFVKRLAGEMVPEVQGSGSGFRSGRRQSQKEVTAVLASGDPPTRNLEPRTHEPSPPSAVPGGQIRGQGRTMGSISRLFSPGQKTKEVSCWPWTTAERSGSPRTPSCWPPGRRGGRSADSIPAGSENWRFPSPRWTAAVSLLLDEYFVERQAGDLRAIAGCATGKRRRCGKPLAYYAARYRARSLVLVHALPDLTRIHGTASQWYILRDSFLSYRQFLERPQSLECSYVLFADWDKEAASEKEIPFGLVPYRAVERYDVMDMLGSVKASGFMVAPLDGERQPMAVSAPRYRIPSRVRLISWDEYRSQSDRLVQVPRRER